MTTENQTTSTENTQNATTTEEVKTEAVDTSLSLDKPTPPTVEPFEETGDAALDLALSFFAANGVSKANPAMKVAQTTGDFSLVKALLDEKGVKGADGYIKVAQQQYQSQKTSAEKAASAAKEEVFKAVGGEAEWGKIKAWAAANATADEAAAINSQLNAGGKHAVIAARYLMNAYERAQAAAPSDKPARRTDAATVSNSTGAPLSPAEYQRAVADLSKRSGTTNLERNPEFLALRARRMSYRG